MKTIAFALLLALGVATVGCKHGSTGEGTTLSRNGLSVTVENGRLVLSDRVHFETNSDQLSAGASDLLDLIAEVLTSHSGITGVRIVGHTDVRGTPEGNQDLSERRATTVANYLRTKGVEQSLSTAGMGQTELVCTGDTPECDEQNRRVEFFLVTE